MAEGLNLQLLKEFNNKLDDTYKKLQLLDAELLKFEKLSTVDIKVGPGIRATSRALDELARSMSRFSSSSPERISAAATNIASFIEQFTRISQDASAESVKSLGKFFSAVGLVFTEVGEVQAQFATFSAGGIGKTTQVVKDVIQPMFSVVATLINQGKDITPERLKSLAQVFLGFETLFKTVSDVTNSLGAVTSGAGPGQAVSTISSLLTALNGLIQNSKDITPERIKQLSAVMVSFGALLIAIREALVTLGTGASGSLVGLIRNFITVQAILLPFIRSIKSVLDAAADLRPGAITAVAQIFASIPVFLREVQNVFAIVKTMNLSQFLTSILALQVLLLQLVGTIVLVIRSTKDVHPDSLRGLGDIFKGFAASMQALIPLMQLVGANSVLDNLKTALKVQIALLPFILSIVGIVKLLGKNTRVDPGIGALFTGLASIITPLLNLVKLFSNVKDLSTIGKIGSGLVAVISPLINFTKALAKIDSRRFDAKGLGELFAGIGKIVTDLSVLDDKSLDDKKLNTVFGTLKRLTDLLKTIKVDKSVATSLAAVAKILEILGGSADSSNLDKLNKTFGQELPDNIKNTEKETSNLQDTIRDAVTGAIFRLELLKAGFTALTKLVGAGIRLYRDFIFPPTVIANNLRNLKLIGDAIKQVGENLKAVGQQFVSFGQSLNSTFGIANLFQSAAVQSAVGFDKISTQVQVFGNLSEEATKEAEALAFTIGQKYPLSANQALDATLSLIKAGQSLGDIEFVLPAAADLAALSDTGDLNTVINTLIASAGAFDEFRTGVEGTFDNIAIATDIIAAAANVSTASVESLGEGLANVGTAANSFGLSLEETTAVLAIFNDAGLKASEGGTALRSLLNALDRPQTAEALNRLNISLFDEGGNRRPLNDIINDISHALDGMPEAQKVAVLQQLTDTFGRQGLSILLGQGEDGINNVVDAMNALPTAAEQAAALLDNLAGDMEQLQGSFETFMLRAALPLIDRFFRPIVQLLRHVVDGFLTLDDSFFEFIGTATALLSIGASLVAGFSVFSGVLLEVGGSVLVLVGSLLDIPLIIGTIVSGLGGLALGFAAISSALLVFVPLILTATTTFETLFEVFSTNAGGATSAARAFFGTIISTVQTVIDFIASFFTVLDVFGKRTDQTISGFEIFGRAIADFFANLSHFFTGGFIGNLRNALGQVTQIFNAFAFIGDAQNQIVELSKSFVDLGFRTGDLDDTLARNRISEQIGAIKESIRSAVANLIQNVPLFGDAVERLFGDRTDASIQAFVDRLFNAFTGIGIGFNKISDAFSQFFTNTLSVGFGPAFEALSKNLDEGLSFVIYNALHLFTSLFGTNEILEALMATIEDGGGIGNFAQTLLKIIVDSIKSAILDNRDTLKNAFLGVVDLFFAGLRNLRFITDLLGAGPISDLFEGFQETLKKLLGGVFDTLVNLLAGQDLKTAIYNAFGDAVLPLFDFVDAIQSVGATLATLFGNFINFLFPPGQETLSEAAQSSFDFLGFIDDITDFLNNLNRLFLAPLAIGDFSTFTSNIGNFVTEFLNNVRSTISTFITGSPDSDYAEIGQAIVDKVAKSVSDAFLNFTTAINVDPTGFIDTLKTSFSGLTDAFNGLFVGTEKDPSTLSDLATIIERISNAFTTLFATSDQAPAEGKSPLQYILDFVGDLAALGIDVLTGVINTINAIFDALANAKAEDITAIGAALAILFAPFIGTALGEGIVLVGTALQGLWTAIAPFLGLIAIGLIVKSFVDNLEEFGQVIDDLKAQDIGAFFTDLADAIGKTFIDFGLPVVNSVLDFFGIDTDYTNEQIRIMAVNLGNTVVNAFKLAGLLLSRLAAQVSADASIAARRAANVFGGDTELNAATQFFDVNKDFSLDAIRKLEADLSAQGITLKNSVTADFAVTNQDEVVAGIESSISAAISDGNPIPINAEDIITFQNLEVLPRLLEDAIFQGNFNLANALLSAAGTAPLDKASVQALVDSITYGVQTGLLTQEEAQTLLLPLKVEPGEITGGDITPEEQNKIVDTALQVVTPTDPVTVDVPVETNLVPADDPAITGSGGFGGEADTQTQNAQDALDQSPPRHLNIPIETDFVPVDTTGTTPTGETPPPVDSATGAPIAQTLDLAGANAATVAQLSTDLANLQTYAAAVKIDLDALLPTLVQLGVDLGTSQSSFDTATASMIVFSTNSVTLNTELQTMQLSLGTILLQLGLLGPAFILASTLGLSAFLLLSTALNTFDLTLTNLLNTLIQGFGIVQVAAEKLAKTLANIVTNAQTIATTIDNATPADGGGDTGTGTGTEGAGHAQGGSFDARNKRQGFGKYRIGEGGSEVLFENGKMYLLSSGRGRIATLNQGLDSINNSASTGLYPTPVSSSSKSGGNVNTINIGGSDIHVEVSGANANPREIADMVSGKVREELDRQPDIVRRELRRNHR